MTDTTTGEVHVPGARPPGSSGIPDLVDDRVVPVRHYTRGLFTAFVLVIVLLGLQALATNPNIEWQVVGQYVFNRGILIGLGDTLEMTAIAMIVSIIGAVIVAFMRMSASRVLSWIAAAYTFVFRGVPFILLLIFIGNLGLFVKTFTVSVPFSGEVLFSRPSADLLTPFVASVIGLSLAGSAYMAEIVRGGLLAVGRGQHEAAKALGLKSWKTTLYIIVPQALRVIIPPMGNELIGMLKATAIVSVIAGGDVLTVAQSISGANYRTIEMLIVAAIWYFAVIVVVSVGQFFLEKRIAER